MMVTESQAQVSSRSFSTGAIARSSASGTGNVRLNNTAISAVDPGVDRAKGSARSSAYFGGQSMSEA